MTITVPLTSPPVECRRTPLTRDELLAWCDADPDARAGRRKSCDSCPVAQFILETTGAVRVSVFGTDAQASNRDGVLVFDAPHAEWLGRLIGRIDQSFGKLTRAAVRKLVLDVASEMRDDQGHE